MARDYSSFSGAAKTRFRDIARELGYEQLSGIAYAKQVDGWYQSFSLQAAGHGNDFFYVNWGIVVPQLCPLETATPVSECGFILWDRLHDVDGTSGFDRSDKSAIEASAKRFLRQYREHALPWFEEVGSWNAIAAEYLRRNRIEEARIGRHTVVFGEDLRAATYGYLLLKAGRSEDALRWLREAERMMSLPVYYTRDGRTVHEKEKFARLDKPTPAYLESLRLVRATIQMILGSPESLAS